jgi:hypothetical protein
MGMLLEFELSAVHRTEGSVNYTREDQDHVTQTEGSGILIASVLSLLVQISLSCEHNLNECNT